MIKSTAKEVVKKFLEDMKTQRNVAEAIFSQFPSEGYPNVVIEDLTKVYNSTHNNDDDIKDGDETKSTFFFSTNRVYFLVYYVKTTILLCL